MTGQHRSIPSIIFSFVAFFKPSGYFFLFLEIGRALRMVDLVSFQGTFRPEVNPQVESSVILGLVDLECPTGHAPVS